MNTTEADAAYARLTAYTLSLGDPAFIHQHVVDTYAVQTATAATKAIRVVGSLAGLQLHLDHGFTGRQVQRVHKILADQRPVWPELRLPADRGSMSVLDVIAEPPGDRRDAAIEAWTASTWEACRELRTPLATFLSIYGVTPPTRD